MIIARMSHGGVAVYDSTTGKLLRWLGVSGGAPTSVAVDDGSAIVTFADGKRSRYDLNTGDFERELHV